ncbi:MAG: IPT/TIG domain-containing protein, partial [Salinispira sp.]
MSLKHHRWLLIASVLVLLCFLIAVFLFLRKPVLTHVSPQQAFPGSSVTIRGYFFGLQEPGSTLRVGNQHITKSHILLWESSRIEFRMPDEMRSGDIVVTRNQRESNGMLLTNINTIP